MGVTTLFGLEGYVPLNRVWFSRSRVLKDKSHELCTCGPKRDACRGFRIPGVLKRGLALNLEDVTVKGQLQMKLYEA